MLSMVKLDSLYFKMTFAVALAALMFLVIPEIGYASTGNVTSRLTTGVRVIQGVITALVVGVGILAGSKIVVKHLPSIDNPQSKNEMWSGLGQVSVAVIAAAAIVWLLPWLWSLFV